MSRKPRAESSVGEVVNFLFDRQFLLLERRDERGVGEWPGRLGSESLVDTGVFGMKSGHMA